MKKWAISAILPSVEDERVTVAMYHVWSVLKEKIDSGVGGIILTITIEEDRRNETK